MAQTYEETLKEWIERFKGRELLRRSSGWLQYDFADEIAEVLSKELQRHERKKNG